MRPVLGIELGPARCALVLVDDRRGAGGAAAPLVDRYAFAAQVMPQPRRAIDAAREQHAARVERV